ncbi:MAG: rod shape-determining protein RodA, partial [Calditrichaeota bacterium]
LFWRAFKIAYECRSRFASQLVIGASTILIFQVMVNVGMTVGIMPVTGLPLPFLSYGGTAMLTSIVLIALILNAGRRRFQYL